MKPLVKVLFFAVLIMCSSCAYVKLADGDNQVGKEENDSRKRVLSSHPLDEDIGSFFISAAGCDKSKPVPGFSDSEKISGMAERMFEQSVKNRNDVEAFTALYAVLSWYPDIARKLCENVLEASKTDFRFFLIFGMVYDMSDLELLLGNGNSAVALLSQMLDVLKKYDSPDVINCESRVFSCKTEIASLILNIYDILHTGKFKLIPWRTFGPPDAKTAGIGAEAVSLLKQQASCFYSRKAFHHLLKHASSMMTAEPDCWFGIPGSMILANGLTNFSEYEITRLEGILSEIIKHDSDFRYWQNYHSVFQMIADGSFDKKTLTDCLEEQCGKHPADLDYLCAAAVLHHLTGNIRKSEEFWEKLYDTANKNNMAVDPETISYYVCFKFFDLNKKEEALNDLKKALTQYPENVSLCLSAVKVFSAQRMIRDADDAARRLPDSFEKNFNLMLFALHDGRIIDGLAFGDIIIREYPASVQSGSEASQFWQAYLQAVFILGRFHSGIKYADDYLKKNPDDEAVLLMAGNFLLKAGMYLERAEDYLNRGLEASPDNPMLLKSMGWLKYRQGDYQEARRKFFESILLSDNRVSEHYIQEFFSQFGDIQAACGEWEIANDFWAISLETGESFLSREERAMLEFKIESSRRLLENKESENK